MTFYRIDIKSKMAGGFANMSIDNMIKLFNTIGVRGVLVYGEEPNSLDFNKDLPIASVNACNPSAVTGYGANMATQFSSSLQGVKNAIIESLIKQDLENCSDVYLVASKEFYGSTICVEELNVCMENIAQDVLSAYESVVVVDKETLVVSTVNKKLFNKRKEFIIGTSFNTYHVAKPEGNNYKYLDSLIKVKEALNTNFLDYISHIHHNMLSYNSFTENGPAVVFQSLGGVKFSYHMNSIITGLTINGDNIDMSYKTVMGVLGTKYSYSPENQGALEHYVSTLVSAIINRDYGFHVFSVIYTEIINTDAFISTCEQINQLEYNIEKDFRLYNNNDIVLLNSILTKGLILYYEWAKSNSDVTVLQFNFSVRYNTNFKFPLKQSISNFFKENISKDIEIIANRPNSYDHNYNISIDISKTRVGKTIKNNLINKIKKLINKLDTEIVELNKQYNIPKYIDINNIDKINIAKAISVLKNFNEKE